MKSYPLALAQEGEDLRVVRLNGGHALDKRLTEIGLNLGSAIRVSHRDGGQFVVIRGETRLALGADLARKVFVAPIGRGADEEGQTR